MVVTMTIASNYWDKPDVDSRCLKKKRKEKKKSSSVACLINERNVIFYLDKVSYTEMILI